jgi:hypothetical protein
MFANKKPFFKKKIKKRKLLKLTLKYSLSLSFMKFKTQHSSDTSEKELHL